MYKERIYNRTSLSRNEGVEGETIEMMMERALQNTGDTKMLEVPNKELIYQAREEGINPAYNVKTDKFEEAIKATDKVTAHMRAKTNEKVKQREELLKPKEPEKTGNEGRDGGDGGE